MEMPGMVKFFPRGTAVSAVNIADTHGKTLRRASAALKGQRDMAIQAAKQTVTKTNSRETRFGIPAGSTSPTKNPSFQNSGEDRIRVRAYFLAEAAGFPEGRAEEFWFKAEKEILG
jgi:hypothetical protein